MLPDLATIVASIDPTWEARVEQLTVGDGTITVVATVPGTDQLELMLTALAELDGLTLLAPTTQPSIGRIQVRALLDRRVGDPPGRVTGEPR